MKIFQNRNIFKKLIIVLLVIMIFSFCMPKNVRAEDENGGVLIKPIVSLFLSLGDGLMGIAHSFVLQQSETMLVVDGDSNVWAWLAGIIVTVAVVAAIMLVVPEILPVLFDAAAGTILLVSVVVGGAAGYAAAAYVDSNFLEDDLKLPIFTLTPQEIFANKIPLFDVDFFNPMDAQEREEVVSPETTKYGDAIEKLDYTEKEENDRKYAEFNFAGHDFKVDITDASGSINGKTINQLIGEDVLEYFKENGENVGNTSSNGGTAEEYQLKVDNIPYKVKRYYDNSARNIKYEYYKGEVTEAVTQTKVLESTAGQLKSTISNWYIVLRDIALVGLLSVLVYVGIRIIISSTSSDKAKYKQLLVDWLVAICLLFFMQYIMSGSNLIVKKVTELLSSAGYPNHLVILDNDQTEKAIEVINGASDGARAALAELGVLGQDQDAESLVQESSDGTKALNWNTNLFGILRVEAQLSKSGKMTYVGYTIMYVMLCLFTIYFIFTYLKRVLYMAFLTIIAPLVALTYPIDKMNDGKAQAFDMWFKEYIFNLLIQPLHLLLYTVLVSSAIELAEKNVLYSIVAIAFLIPAEKLMRKFFGFEKAQTPGLLAGPAGAALTMTGLNKLMGHRPPKHGGNEKLGGKASEESENKKIAFNSKFNKQDGIINAAMNSKEKNKNEQDEDTWNSFFKNTNSRNDKDNKALSTDLTQLNSANPVFNDNKNKGRKLRAIGGYSRAVRKYGSAMKGKMKNYASNVHPIRTATKIAAGAAGAAIFGTAAGIAGLTSGDANKAVQYASTGVLGGYKLGDSLAGGVQSTLSVPVDLKDEFQQGYYDTEEYEQHIKERQQDEMKKSSEVKWALEDNFGKEEADYIRNNVMDDYTDAGVTDINDIIAGYKAEKEGELSREKAISGIKYSNRIGKDTDAMDDLSKWQKRFSEEFAKNERVREANLDAEKLGQQTMNAVEIINKYKYKKK